MGEWKDGGSAFPAVGEVYGDENDSRWSPGMSLRDYFAATATEKDISEYLPVTDGEARRLKERVGVTQMRQWARYKHADAMLFERERENE